MSTSLDVHVPISEAEAQLLANLIGELFPLAAIPDAGYLSRVKIVPRREIAPLINVVLQQFGAPRASYEPGPHATAVAVPIEYDGHFTTFILVAGELVQQLTSDRYHPYELVSALLEELLHVAIYVTTWQQRGHLSPPLLSRRERDIFTVCSNFHDEYIVSRRKARLAADMPLFDAPDQPGYVSPRFLVYGEDLASTLDAADQELATLHQQTITGQLTAEQSWGLFLRLAHRKIFDPLAREAGFRQGLPEAHRRPNNPLASTFYQDRVEPYWQRVLATLERSFDSDLEEMAAAKEDLMQIIREFLEDISTLPQAKHAL